MEGVDKFCGWKSENQQFAQSKKIVEKKCPNFQKMKKSYPHSKMWKIWQNPIYQPSYPLYPHKKIEILTVYIVFSKQVFCVFLIKLINVDIYFEKIVDFFNVKK